MQFQETDNIELKTILNDSFEREVVAFLNTDGGTIYIGVNNEGQIVGVDNIDGIMKEISNVCIDRILPLPTEFIDTKAIYEEGKMIIVVNIQKGNSLFYIKRYGRSSLGCYMRVGTTVRAMNEAQIEKKFIKSLEISEKTIFEKRNYRQNLSFTILKTLLLSKGQHINDESFNETYILLNENNEFNYYAGLLDDNADVSIKVATFKGKDKTLFLKRQEFGFQCLLIAMKNVISYIDSINDTYIDTSVRLRIEKRKFSQEAFIEAWTNAVVHNDWKQGVPPAIYVYDDRLEIVSIGGLPKGQTIESFFKGRSVPINEPMIRLFMKLDLMEQNGHGIPIIIKEYGKEAFEIEDNCISVTIPFNNIVSSKDVYVINNSLNEEFDSLNEEFDSLNCYELIVLKLIFQNPRIMRKEIADKSNISIANIDRIIKRLKEKGIIKRIGSKKNGYWKVNAN